MEHRGRDTRRVSAPIEDTRTSVRAKSSSAIGAKPKLSHDWNRSSTQLALLPSKRGGLCRNSGELLLYTALNNSQLSDRQKRLPKLNTDPNNANEMKPTFRNPRYLVNAEQKLQRPQVRRWNSSNDAQPLSISPTVVERPDRFRSQRALCNSNSSSTLSVLNDQYDTTRPQVNYVSTDNTFRDLNKDIKPFKESKDDNISNENTDTLALKFYTRMSNVISIAQNGINSLVPSRFNSMVDTSYGTGRPAKSTLLLHSESEDEEDDGHDADEENYEEDSESFSGAFRDGSRSYDNSVWDSPAISSLKVGKKESVGNIQDIMKEITDFQSNFVNKFGDDTNLNNEKFNRTQQRILDYKELENNTSLQGLNNPIAFESYNYRIQYETIINQYNSIRFRFASKTITKDNKIRVDTGVLGFINRQEKFDYLKATDSKQPKLISEQDKDEYLQKLWDKENSQTFKTVSENPENTCSNSSVVSSNTNFSASCTNTSLSTTNMNMLEMARSVKLGQANI